MGAGLPTVGDSVYGVSDPPDPSKFNLDPDKAAAAISSTIGKVSDAYDASVQASTVQGGQAEDLVRTAKEAKDKYAHVIDAILPQIDETKATMDDAYAKLGRYKAVPPIIGMLGSLLGNDAINPAFQQARIDNAARQLQLTNQRVETIGAAATAAQSSADFATRGLKDVASERSGQATAIEGGARSIAEMDTVKYQQQLRTANNMTLEQLQSEKMNPTELSRNLPAGMLEQEILRKQTAKTEFEKLGVMLGNEKLQGKILGIEAKTKEESAAVDSAKRALSNVSDSDFAAIQRAVTKDGYADVKLNDGSSFKISNQLLQVVNQTRNAEAAARTEKLAPIREAQANVETNLPVVASQATRLVQSAGNVVPPEASAQVKASIGTITALHDNYLRTGRMEDIVAAGKMTTELVKQIGELKDKYVTSRPEPERQAAKQHIESGEVETSAGATFLSSYMPSITAFQAFDPGSSFAQPFAIMSAQLKKDIQANESIMPAGGVNATNAAAIAAQGGRPGGFSRDKWPAGELMNYSMSQPAQIPKGQEDPSNPNPTVREYAQRQLIAGEQNTVLNNLITSLAKDTPQGPGLQAYKMIMPNGQLDPKYLSPVDRRTPNYGAIINDLATMDVKTGSNNLQLLRGRLMEPEFVKSYVGQFVNNYNTVQHSALISTLLRNDPQSIITDLNAKITYQQQVAREQFEAYKRALATPQQFGAGDSGPIPMGGNGVNPAHAARFGQITQVPPISPAQ